MDYAADFPLPLTSPRAGASFSVYETGSRIIQVTLSVVGLIVLLPVAVVLAAAIKIVSPGPVFYRGERVGRNGRLFTILKFRTLEVGAEKKIGARLLRKDDAFYHRLGRFLKRTKLDEIPQLVNVIRGEMNLVGPRPIRPVFLEKLTADIPRYTRRFEVRPGMTGLAQLRGGYYTSDRNKWRYDMLYIRNRSFRLDLGILLMTFLKLLQRWVTAGSILCVLVLFVSFVPAGIVESLSARVMGVEFNPLIPAILAAGAYLALEAGKSNKWFISHSAIDWPMLTFIFLSLMAIPFSAAPLTAFRGLVYMCVTGFFTAFVLVNLRPDLRFACRASQLLGLAGGGLALLGLGETLLALIRHTPAGTRSVATLGSPLALTAYLAVCFPMALCELITSTNPHARRLWLAVSAVIAAAVVAAGSRFGMPALMVSAGVLLVKADIATPRRMLAVAAASMVALCVLGGERYSPSSIVRQAVHDGGAVVAAIQRSPFQQLLIGYGSKTLTYPSPSSSVRRFGWSTPLPSSTYLTLLLENGIAGLCLMMWLATLVVREISISVFGKPRELQLRLWSLAAALWGLAVAAISFNIFHNLTTQLLFWCVVGTALGLCVRYGRRDHGAVLVMRFGH